MRSEETASIFTNNLNNINEFPLETDITQIKEKLEKEILHHLQNSIQDDLTWEAYKAKLTTVLTRDTFDEILANMNMPKFNTTNPKPSEETITSNDSVEINVAKQPKRVKSNMTNTKCEHINSKHYAKNKCYNCYHREGRNKKAWGCPHINKSHYAHGLCHNCYQNKMVKKNKKSKSASSASFNNLDIDFENN